MKILYLLFIFLEICQSSNTTQKLVAYNITYSSFQLRWPASNQTEEYSLTIENEDSNQDSTVLVDTNINCSVICEYNFIEAPPNSLIQAEVFAKQGQLQYSFTTKELPKAKFQINNVTQSGFIISLKQSDSFLENGGSFRVEIIDNSLILDSFNLTRDIKNYIFNQGRSLTTYQIKVTASYKNFQGKPVVKTTETLPDFLVNLGVKNITETGFTVVWNNTIQNFTSSHDNFYRIEIIEENSDNPLNITEEVKNNEYEFKNGSPLTVYNITIFYTIFYKDKGYEGKSTTSIETEPEVPGPPHNFHYKVTGSNVDIEWEPPNVKDGTIKNYTVSIYDLGIQFGEECKDIKPRNFTNTTENLSYSISLLPFHKYRVIIVGNTRSGSGERLHEIIKTNAKEIKKPIINIVDTVTDITKDYYNVSKLLIVSTQCNPGPIDQYKIEVNDPSQNISSSYKASAKLELQLKDLKPWFKYTITVTSITFQDNLKNDSSVKSFSTPEGFPGPPKAISYLENRSELVWIEPEESRGLILYYHIYLEDVGIRDHGFDCNRIPYENYTRVYGTDSLKQTFKFSPFHKYYVKINAETRKGIGKNTSLTILTEPTKPEPPTDINYCINQDLNQQTFLSLSFKSPCRSNGIFIKYGVKVNGDIKNLITNKTTSWIISPEMPINISVVIYTSEFNSSTEETLPQSVPHISNTIGLPIVNNETNLIEFTLKKSDFHGYDKIEGFSLMVTNESMISNDIPTKWILYRGEVCKNNTNNTGTNNDLPRNPNLIGSEYLGDPFPNFASEKKIYICPLEYSENLNCIRVPLQKEIEYFLIIRVFTKHFYGDSQKLSFRTASYPMATLPLALGISFGLLLIFVLTSLAIFYYFKEGHPIFSKLHNPKQDRLIPKSTEEHECHKCLPSQFPIYLKNIKSTENGLKIQFSNLGKLSQEISSSNTTQIAQLPQNRKKNRYINILPYDFTRVILPDDEYINASYIKGKSGYVEYIACQGPLRDTCKDFWHMVLHEKVSIIVMITQFTENKKDKCFEYFPSLNASMIEDDMTITCIAEESYNDYVLKKLEIENEETIVTVDHLHFLNWPDFGVPTTTECILKFVKEVRKKYKHGKILVHCSAGVGRTGTFITLDISMATIDKQQEIDIYNMVLNLRKQRCLMVQTLAQYEYIHDCVANYINFEQESIM